MALHAAWRATGDRSLIERHLPNAEACLTWIDKYGDRDGDGFQEYQTRSTAGYENMAWKDSGDAVMYPDGTLVRGPKALCELQGYVYDAWLRMAEIYDELGNKRRANALRKKAAALFKKFNEDFWDEESGFYAFALDGEKKKVLSVASNVGQCLWSGIIAPERAGRVVKRLMRKDMWSGWGIRTLSADHPAFNPYNYQTGAVWPHDNSLIALGMRRYGFAAEAAAVARDISGAASHFLLNQLPELYGGLQRDRHEFPGAVSGRQRTAGLGGGNAVHAAAGDAGAAAGRAARQALCRSRAAGLAAGRDADRSAVGSAAVRYPLLAGRKGHALQGSDGQARRGGVEERRAVRKRGRRVTTELDCRCGVRPSREVLRAEQRHLPHDVGLGKLASKKARTNTPGCRPTGTASPARSW